MEEVLIGIDLGTTNIKVAAFDAKGALLALANNPTPVHYPRPGWAEFQPPEIWDTLCRGLRQVTDEIEKPGRIQAIATASMGEAGVLVDEKGNWLSSIIAWFDNRTGPQARWWEENFGAEKLFQITGLPLHPMFSIHKLMWLKDNQPELLEQAKKWLCMEDLVIHQLTGEYATSQSIASRTMALDIKQRVWSDWIFEKAGIDADLMPPAVPSGQVVGEVTDQASKVTGLPPGTKVVTGGHDHVCGALAAGIVEPGVMLDSSGTTESFLVNVEEPVLAPELCQAGYAYGCNVIPDRYILFGFIISSGIILEWLKDVLGFGSVAEMAAEAEDAPLGCHGAMLLPHFRGSGTPDNDSGSRGAFVGLTTSTSRSDLVRAVLEGICYEMQCNIQFFEHWLGTKIEKIRAIGGGAKNPFWCQMKSDISGKPLEVTEVTESTACGAAMLAGIGAGVFSGVGEAVGLIPTSATYQPRPKITDQYQAWWNQAYRGIYPTLRDLNVSINRQAAQS